MVSINGAGVGNGGYKMTPDQISRIEQMLGRDTFLTLCESFPNARLPGKKFLWRLKRKDCISSLNALAGSVEEQAQKAGVTKQTVYRWWNQRKHISRQKHQLNHMKER
jgi:DNA invertase Pin-like site-specific DNA recombinase